jgi:hypothetical protein
MKTRGMMMIVVLAMGVALMAAPAMAQTINLKADVPFDFAAGDVMLSSGHCSLQTISNNIVRLSDAEHHSSATILNGDDVRSANDAKLIFHLYGDRYFLARVETPEMSYKVPISSREMKLARKVSPKEVAVLAHSAVGGE